MGPSKNQNGVLAADIGGTHGRVGLFADVNATVPRQVTKFRVTKAPNGNFEHDFEQLVSAAGELIALYGVPKSMGVSLAGFLEPTRSMLLGSGNLGHWVNRELKDRLSKELGCPVIFGGDAEAPALAEDLHGNPTREDFQFMVWGTGMGGAFRSQNPANGKPIVWAGEPGHQKVGNRTNRLCNCGQFDCLEALVGGAGIAKRFGVPAEELTKEQWDAVCNDMVDGLRNIMAIQPVPQIIFGGGVICKQPHLLPIIEERLREELKVVTAPRLRLSVFGESAGLVGAVALTSLLN